MSTKVETYHTILGTAHYEWRVEEAGHMSGWQDAGHVSADCLAQIKAGLAHATYWEVRKVVSVVDSNGTYAGLLYLTERIAGGTDFEPGER